MRPRTGNGAKRRRSDEVGKPGNGTRLGGRKPKSWKAGEYGIGIRVWPRGPRSVVSAVLFVHLAPVTASAVG